MRASCWEAENVGRQLHGSVTLRSASGDAQFGNGNAAASFGPLFTVPQGIGQSF